MPMSKDVTVTVTGTKDGEVIKTKSAGILYEKDGYTFVSYEDKSDEESVSKNLLKVSTGVVEMTRKGALSVKFVFEKGKQTRSSYSTMYGALAMEVFTKKLNVNQSEEGILIDIVYDMSVNEGPKEETKINIEVK